MQLVLRPSHAHPEQCVCKADVLDTLHEMDHGRHFHHVSKIEYHMEIDRQLPLVSPDILREFELLSYRVSNSLWFF